MAWVHQLLAQRVAALGLPDSLDMCPCSAVRCKSCECRVHMGCFVVVTDVALKDGPWHPHLAGCRIVATTLAVPGGRCAVVRFGVDVNNEVFQLPSVDAAEGQRSITAGTGTAAGQGNGAL